MWFLSEYQRIRPLFSWNNYSKEAEDVFIVKLFLFKPANWNFCNRQTRSKLTTSFWNCWTCGSSNVRCFSQASARVNMFDRNINSEWSDWLCCCVCVLGERLVTNFRLQRSKSTQEEARVCVSLSRCEHLSSRGSVEIVADRSVVDKKTSQLFSVVSNEGRPWKLNAAQIKKSSASL